MNSIAFDTLKYTKKLESAGFTREQAEAQVYIQQEAIAEMLDMETSKFVTKEDLTKELAPIKSDITAIRTNIAVLMWMSGLTILTVVVPALKKLLLL
jgi:Protein of unknown function (DUF1640)